MTKYRLYLYEEDLQGWFRAEVIKCDLCDEMFQVRKGFALSEGGNTMICYKHLKIGDS